MNDGTYPENAVLQMARYRAGPGPFEDWPGGKALVVRSDDHVVFVRRWVPLRSGWTKHAYRVATEWPWMVAQEASHAR
jgi:hypothetical protein